MQAVERSSSARRKNKAADKIPCYHCGTLCLSGATVTDGKAFCCDGCRLVYGLINDNGLCNYYELQQYPGLSRIKIVRPDKYSFLDKDSIAEKLYRFTDGDHTIVTFYIPGVHCSSCMWLLEHLRKLNDGISESRLNFSTREVTIHFSRKKISLSALAGLLTTIGYEPYISLDDLDEKKAVRPDRKRLYRLGIAGFCFANIMMMSFPEYLGGAGFEKQYAIIFRYLNLVVALPVFFYSAGAFFDTAWKGLRARTLNIDAPVALAIIITFIRSVYEIISGTGAGYLDSMSGIVFFMLAGRMVQERTYRSISFHRDYKSYFPIAVTVLGEQGRESRSLHDLHSGDKVQLQHDEIIPADAILLEGHARIDYSFVTGESDPVRIETGEKIFAGGRQTGEQILLEIVTPVSASYLTSLWNHEAFSTDEPTGKKASSIDVLSRYFTIVLFSLALLTGIYHAVSDPSKMWNSVTAMLIVACPCALLLSATFTNGNLLRIFSRSGLYLRDASVIETLAHIDHIAFDKTGTLTEGTKVQLCGQAVMSAYELGILHQVTRSSNHPYSQALANYTAGTASGTTTLWREITGLGIEAIVDGIPVKVGSAAFTGAFYNDANVHVLIGNKLYSFIIAPRFRSRLHQVMQRLGKRFQLSLLSGDNARQLPVLEQLFSSGSQLHFEQQPADKLRFIEQLQQQGHKVLMVGDGLNDAGALKQSNAGITLAADINNFTPACDAIMDARRFEQLPAFLKMARTGQKIIGLSFAISICYNVCGLYFAVQGKLNPMIAAILMPASTLTIVLISTGASTIAARMYGLTQRTGKT